MVGRTFWNGVKVILPLGITVAVLYWIFIAIEHFFGFFVKLIVGNKYYFPGLGFLVGIVLVFIVGIFMNAWLGRKLHELGERLLKKIPLVRWLYNSLTDLMSFFESRKNQEMKNVVMVELGGVRILAFVTREDYSGLIEGLGLEGEITVYLPMSYQIGGYMVNVPREAVTPLEMTFEHAMRYVLTAGMIGDKKA